MTYSITMYLGNLGFTNDYSNVLHFDNREARDKYFDSISGTPNVNSIDVYNSDVNRIMMEGNRVKIAFDTAMFGDITETGSSDIFDKVTYMCINTEFRHQNIQSEISSTDSRKYYFVNSYEIISSNVNVTVVSFVIEYDYWMNNQFDFEIKPSNVERMHVDRWDASENKIIYKRPVLDSIESNMKVFREDIVSEDINTILEDGNYKPFLWCVVTASHTLGYDRDTLLYHIIPIKYRGKDLKLNTDAISDPYANDSEFFYQDCIKYDTINNIDYYYPSIHMLDSGYLAAACGNGGTWGPLSGDTKDEVTIINVQILVDLPLRVTNAPHKIQIRIQDEVTPGASRWRDLPICFAPATSSPIISELLASAYVTDFSVFVTAPKLSRATNVFEISRPVKPFEFINNVKAPYDYSHEPALYLSPVMVRYVSCADNTAMSIIPDQVILDLYTANMVDVSVSRPYIALKFDMCVSYSSTNMYNYIVFDNYTRESLNKIGFAFNKISYMWDFVNDSYENYVMTQRDSDRMMMWTNIATGGISEMGSTAVSAGIGYRSNAERAMLLENSIKPDQALMNYSQGGIQEARISRNVDVNKLNANMYRGMAKNAMAMSGIGGVTAFSANAIHQGMAQRSKEKAMANQPPATATSGNTCSSLANSDLSIVYTETICDDSTFNLYKNIFHKFGYYIGAVTDPQLYNRKFFNYIKTNGCILTGEVNNLILSALASIFDNGVTIWHMDYCVEYTDDEITDILVYNYSYENIERSLI